MNEKIYKVPVIYVMSGIIEVSAKTPWEAIKKTEKEPVPEHGEYIEGTLTVNEEIFNWWLKDEENQ